MTTAEAAERLGVGARAVRRLLSSGRLVKAGAAGRVLLIDTASVERLALTGTRRGRPWSQPVAWAALSMLSGLDVDWIGSSEKARLKARLRDLTADDVAILSRNRSTCRRYQGTPDAVDVLRSHLLPSGAAAMGVDEIAERFGLAVGDAAVEGYVAEGDATELEAALGLRADTEGNVVIREVTATAAFRGGQVPVAAIALDLMESPATRERSAGRRVLEELLHDRR
ncbi:helix-turn-helix domain-containing protein [Specibacter cremeus]|uniref:helix-turn-helix domain-containing protein n=1 Tax=Specibacter cremeus TaxID=1629051 RepID=UPI001F0C1FC7|nr:helix-turn-helix domain-containing protein [Specibacter cremeus]